MFLMRNKENNFPIYTLIWRPGVLVFDLVHSVLSCFVIILRKRELVALLWFVTVLLISLSTSLDAMGCFSLLVPWNGL